MRKWIVGLACVVLGVASVPMASAQILTFDFDGLAGNEATADSNSNDVNLTSSTISRGAGLTAAANANRFNATSWALTDIATAVAGDDYMEFTITPQAGYQFDVSSIYIQFQRSNTGPRGLALRSSVDNYASDLEAEKSVEDSTSTQNFTWTFSQANSAEAVTYRIYGWAESVTGSGGIGDGSGNDLVVYGTVSLAGFGVSFDKATGFKVTQGSSDAITATASEGTEPYTYAWSSTLGASYYSTNDNIFTILATAPAGDYSATVEATDASPATVSNTINFSVVTMYDIIITPPTNGTVTTTPETEAEEGQAVAINATPAGGYAVDAMTVVDSTGGVVSVSGGGFTMPADDVTVTVTFKVHTASTLYITEVADPADYYQGRFIELYNAGDSSIDLAAGQWNIAKQVIATGTNIYSVALTGTVAAGSTYVVAGYTNFPDLYPSAPSGTPDQYSSTISGNGDDAYFLYSGGDHTIGTLEDAYGVFDEDGTGTDWEYLDARANRNTNSTVGSQTWIAADWTITDPADTTEMTPGVYPDGDPVFYVALNKADGFTISFGESETVTATAGNGTEPYTYVWSSDLGATYYSADSNAFTILDTAPIGSYSVTVVASDSASQSVSNTISFNVVLDIATLPVAENYSSTFDWTTLPGWSGVGVGTYSSGAMKFDGSGQMLTVHVDGVPGELTFDLYGNASTAGTAPMQYDIEESADGETWTVVASLTDTDLSTSTQSYGPYTLANTTRYIRWNYVNKYAYNVGLNNVAITSGGPPVFGVTFDKTSGFVVDEGSSNAVTATAVNGEEPYGYTWSSDLGTDYYSTNDNVFTILGTAPVGSYSAEVIATESSTNALSVTNTIHFTVATPGITNTITITPTANGTVTTTPTNEAASGVTVTINATPSTGFQVDAVTVIDDDTNPVTVTNMTFVMPATGVTVNVTFSLIPTGAEIAIDGTLGGNVNEELALTITLTNSATAASDWTIVLTDPALSPIWTYSWDPGTGAFSFTPTLTGDYSLSVTALDSEASPLASTNATLTVTSPAVNPSISNITFVVGTGFTFDVPTGYSLTRVEGAVTTLVGEAFDWQTLTEGTDYTFSDPTVTILSDAVLTSGYGRMIRIVVTAD